MLTKHFRSELFDDSDYCTSQINYYETKVTRIAGYSIRAASFFLIVLYLILKTISPEQLTTERQGYKFITVYTCITFHFLQQHQGKRVYLTLITRFRCYIFVTEKKMHSEAEFLFWEICFPFMTNNKNLGKSQG